MGQDANALISEHSVANFAVHPGFQRNGAGTSRMTLPLHPVKGHGSEELIGGIVGSSLPMRRMVRVLRKIADCAAPVFIAGESGTGKELVARAIHGASARSEGPFVAVNCAALSANLLESELFGHVRGAFTDARADHKGLFVQASGGTLFLDEIGELPAELQPKLLRVLQDHRVRPVGGTVEREVDVRVVSATNRDLEREVADHRFRQDLFYRVNVIQLQMPRLCDRGGDILVLARHFLSCIAEREGQPICTLAPEAAAKLLEYDWPGNVRELDNAMERAAALARGGRVELADLPERIREHHGQVADVAEAPLDPMPTLGQVERRYVRRVLNATAGNKTQAAGILGINRRTLYRMLERFDRQS